MKEKNTQIAVKVNGMVSERINVKDVVLQGSVWGSLKCTTSIDILNKIAISDDTLQYGYKEDSNIPIGVLGMVDNTLAVSECGNPSIKKNAVINSFVDTQRLTFSQNKSVVLHIGKTNKCKLPCQNLKVHKEIMLKKESTKYLGHILSANGSNDSTIEDRRNKGWGKISTIMGILEEVDMGANRLEAGLLLREAILVSGLLYSAEALSNLTDKQIARLEVVDTL